MNHPIHLTVLLLRLSFGAMSLALGFLTLAALASPAFAAALVEQGMPLPLSWPAVLAEFGSALVFLGLHAPRRPRSVARPTNYESADCKPFSSHHARNAATVRSCR